MSTGPTNNDAWLHALRSDPSPAFTQQLQARLRAQEPERDTVHTWPMRALAAAAAVVVVAGLLAVPGVRASVAQFVSLFRVTNFVAVPVDAGRLDRLEAKNLEIGALIGEHVEIVRNPGPPVSVASLEEAATTAGMTLAVPQWLPENTHVMEAAVVGERVVRVTANSLRLQQVMDALGINDLTVPAGLDGQVVNIRVPPVVMIRFDHGKSRTRLYQAQSPQITLPNGINVQALGEIGLRILGLEPAQAKQIAEAMDWNSTFILPVPPNASSFQQVVIGGRRGVLIAHQAPNEAPTTTLVWSTSDRVFALMTIAGSEQALAMAESVR